MSIKHIILCIEFVFLAVQIIMARAAYKSPLKYGKTAVQHSNQKIDTERVF